MRFAISAAVLSGAAVTTAWAQIPDEKLAKAECWMVFGGFAEKAVISVDAPGGIVASFKPGDVVDVIELMSLKAATREHVVRIYELRDGTKFVCRLDRR